MASLELQAFREHFGELSQAISDPEWLASRLFSEGLISDEALDDAITAMGVSRTYRTRRVLWHFERTLAGKPESFQILVSTLKSAKHLEWIANRVETSYSNIM
jgi:hypothetical protein